MFLAAAMVPPRQGGSGESSLYRTAVTALSTGVTSNSVRHLKKEIRAIARNLSKAEEEEDRVSGSL